MPRVVVEVMDRAGMSPLMGLLKRLSVLGRAKASCSKHNKNQ
jgi:hypothetical protein